jgi:hypothetical protein
MYVSRLAHVVNKSDCAPAALQNRKRNSLAWLFSFMPRYVHGSYANSNAWKCGRAQAGQRSCGFCLDVTDRAMQETIYLRWPVAELCRLFRYS